MELWRHYERSLVRLVARGAGKVAARAATVDGSRKPLAWVVDEFFVGMTSELERLGVGRRVASGMFGVSRRTYIRQLQAAVIGTQAHSDSLWWLVLQSIQAGSLSREGVLARFASRSPELIGAILFDMLETELIAEMDGIYVATRVADDWSDERLRNFIHMLAGEHELPDVDELAGTLGVGADRITAALADIERHYTVTDAEHEGLWGLLELFVEHAFIIAHRELSGDQTDGFVFRIALTDTGEKQLPRLQEIVSEGRARVREQLSELLEQRGTTEEAGNLFFTTVLSQIAHKRGWLEE